MQVSFSFCRKLINLTFKLDPKDFYGFLPGEKVFLSKNIRFPGTVTQVDSKGIEVNSAEKRHNFNGIEDVSEHICKAADIFFCESLKKIPYHSTELILEGNHLDQVKKGDFHLAILSHEEFLSFKIRFVHLSSPIFCNFLSFLEFFF